MISGCAERRSAGRWGCWTPFPSSPRRLRRSASCPGSDDGSVSLTRAGRPFTEAEKDRVRTLCRQGTPAVAALATAAAGMGRTVSSLKNMAHFLGASARRPAGSKPGTPVAPTVPRRCLRCAAVFPSEGAHHRVCDRCKESDDWQAGTDYELGSPS